MTELKKVKVVTSGYIKQFYGVDEKFVHLEDYQRLRDEKHKLPEGYHEEKIFVEGPVQGPVHLYCGEREIAFLYSQGELWIPKKTLGAKDAEALAIFLQRRLR